MNFDHIHLFKTNICTESDKQRVKFLLESRDDIEDWNVDQEDEDRVLRVVSCSLKKQTIIQLLRGKGYLCIELV
ncbi:hypothetical protein [Mucilaginibacter sp. UYCu711]|uniref:hypothetical protein n=1 Tax=Mucilaginibacter sp. UYCu711 TaxID=3156339 RepID=UPI003D1929F1